MHRDLRWKSARQALSGDLSPPPFPEAEGDRQDRDAVKRLLAQRHVNINLAEHPGTTFRLAAPDLERLDQTFITLSPPVMLNDPRRQDLLYFLFQYATTHRLDKDQLLHGFRLLPILDISAGRVMLSKFTSLTAHPTGLRGCPDCLNAVYIKTWGAASITSNGEAVVALEERDDLDGYVYGGQTVSTHHRGARYPRGEIPTSWYCVRHGLNQFDRDSAEMALIAVLRYAFPKVGVYKKCLNVSAFGVNYYIRIPQDHLPAAVGIDEARRRFLLREQFISVPLVHNRLVLGRAVFVGTAPPLRRPERDPEDDTISPQGRALTFLANIYGGLGNLLDQFPEHCSDGRADNFFLKAKPVDVAEATSKLFLNSVVQQSNLIFMVGYRLTSIATVSEVDYLRKTVGTATLVRISKDQHHIIFWGIDAGLLTTWSYGEYDLEWYLGLLMVALQEAAVQFLGGGVEPSWSLDLMRSQIEKYNGSEVYRRIRQLRFKASTVLRRRLSEADPELLPMLQQEENGDRLRWLEIYEKVLNTDLSKIKVTAVPAGTSGENLVVSRHVLLWAVQAHDDRLWEMLPEEREVVFHRVGIARNLWMQETAIKNQRRKTPERFIGIPESDVLRQYGVVVEEANIKKRLRRIEEAKETDEHVVCLICGAVMFGTFTQDGSMKHIGYDSRKTDWVCMTKVRREGWSAIITETEAEGKALGSEIRRNGSPYSRWLATLREGYEANKIQVRKDIATFLQQNVVEIPGALQVITLVDDDLLTHIELQTCLSKAPEVHPLALDPVLESRAPTQREKDAGVKGSMWSLRIIAPRAVKKVKSVVQKRWKKEEEDLLIADVRDIPEAQRGRTGCPSKPDLQRLGAKYGVSESSVQSKIMSLLKKY